MAPRGFDQQGPENDQEGHRQRGDGGDHGVADRFQPQPVPAPLFDHAIGAVQAHAQAFNPVRCKIEREHDADGQNAAVRLGQHVVNLAGQCICHLRRPGFQDHFGGLVGEFFRAEETGEEVMTIRKGNSAISAESAMWLAIAQPSSARNV
jgi:hypothetical protein